ncbi:hypothetical protein BD626DRAFT_565494 [Schizophyllum amplum]|uniref:Uncharacterized protein n=1 Tax=Schizophyllum amplum TaxID=97359 RepID=A0A550CV51_9AGAR|nr:hypothetical protein BD626DRAFT_565494 [Auriculariopsis ampla]
MPPVYALCYYTNVYTLLECARERGIDVYGDEHLTFLDFLDQLEEAVGNSRRKGGGVHRLEQRSQIYYILVISMSEKQETVPHPLRRIASFKELLFTTNEPAIHKIVSPKMGYNP